MDGSTQLYRHFDANGCLLYVGISLNTVKRLAEHRQDSRWFNQIARVEIEHFPSRKQAMMAEQVAILTEGPLHNIQQNSSLLRREYELTPYKTAGDSRHLLRSRLDEFDEQDRSVVKTRPPENGEAVCAWPGCGRLFKKRTNNHKFCGNPECRKSGKKEYTATCPGCGDEFVSHMPQQKWCDQSCHNRFKSREKKQTRTSTPAFACEPIEAEKLAA
jgi:hypothetical protein